MLSNSRCLILSNICSGTLRCTMECRLCLRFVPAKSSLPIFDDQEIPENIWRCCQLRVKNQNWMPNTICMLCNSYLISMKDFKETSSSSEAKARLTLTESTTIKVEEVILDDLAWREDEFHSNQTNLEQISRRQISSTQNCADKSICTSDIKNHTVEKPNECSVCSKRFIRKYCLKRHMICHTGEKPYKCHMCSKCFVFIDNFKQHMKIHNGEKPHQCDVCSKRFASSSSLKIHIMSHTKVKPHKCDICSKCFASKSRLNQHLKIHTGEKPHQCDVCYKRFASSSNIKIHMTSHTGEKPHKCNVCSKCFAIKSKLNLHMKIHTGKKSHKCNVCSKCFVIKSYLTEHMKYHTGEKRKAV